MSIQNIVLDIDNTLLHGISKRPSPHSMFDKVPPISPDAEDESYIYYYRPGVHEFLDKVFSKYNVGIFTAASSEYAQFIVNSLFKQHKEKLHFVYSQREYDECKYITGGMKDLSYVEQKYPLFRSMNTIIIDDCYAVKGTNRDKCIQIKHYKRRNEEHDSDEELSKLMTRM